ncbi:hypothetical protein Gocc_2368 [Gaiella occulta]|uniref:Fibronectin type-III domain-containing protein n=1 Tax=Gaiella occulta TaxID=1002870 RepID=A0A7M2YVA5_9ACTN|nr:hypothetical protein [Gaiella occulta]RDI73804.1 hypothetical protein Gocc_2368 [Gaiella occulta]
MSKRASTRGTALRRRPEVVIAGLGAAIAALLAGLALGSGDAQAQGQAAPQNTAEPTISGTPEIGMTLTGNRGSWSGDPITYAYAWLRCDSAVASCTPVANATGTGYQLTSSDAGWRMVFRVTATNVDGSTTKASNATAVVGSTGAPVATKDPSVSGTPAVEQRLTADPGTWTGQQPITFTFRWLRCDGNGNNCVEISGATDDQYVVKSSDLGRTLRVRISARNSQGEIAKLTPPTAKVAAGGVPGAIKLPNGETSIPATSVPASERLIVANVSFSPSPVRSRSTPITLRVKVVDTRGYAVRDVLVFVRATPVVTSTPVVQKTAEDGFVSYTVQPQADFPIRNGYSVQFFVKAYRQGDNPLGGVAGYRLVQVPTVR